ncbi:MAG: hypothetical protein ACOYIF_05815 [Acetivibrionales bacterium]
MGAAILFCRGEGSAFAGILRVFLKVGVDWVAFAKLIIVLKVNGELPDSHLVYLI